MKPPVSDELREIIVALQRAGGRPLLVGGAVRDWLLGNAPKDLDIEVYSMTPEALVDTLRRYGRVDQVGMSFGVIKLRTKRGSEFDFSMPRRESKTGDGHRGFMVQPDPGMSIEEACGRRDFTMNAMAYDFSSEKLLDFYGGREDLLDGVLRHTTSAFTEDPLRVLRGFQFASRFEMNVAAETAELCASIKGTFKHLPKERIWGEWEKWVTKGKDLILGLEYLIHTQWIENFSPLSAEHRPLWDVINETIGDPLQTFAVLCKGLSPLNAGSFLRSIGAVKVGDCKDIDVKVQKIKDAEHETFKIHSVEPHHARRLAVQLHPATVEQFCTFFDAKDSEIAAWARQVGVWTKKPDPIIMGRHLTGLVEPGPRMGKTLKDLYEAQLDGKFSDEAGGLALAKELLSKCQ